MLDFLTKDWNLKKKCKRHGITRHKLDNKTNRYYCVKCWVAEDRRLRRIAFKLKAIRYKGGSCSKCGYLSSLNALEFHHLNKGEKEFSISKYATSKPWEEIRIELDKCVLLCANCHREEHENS